MTITRILREATLLVILIASSSLVEARRSSCLCGGLGEGTDPCRGPSGHRVKAVQLPKPFVYASESAINEAAAARDAAAAATAAAAAYSSSSRGSSGGCSGCSMHSGTTIGHEADYGPSAQDLLSLDPHTPIAPRFRPIGDLCHSAMPEQDTSTTVLPAYPGRPRCSICNGHANYLRTSSGSSRSASSTRHGSSFSSGYQSDNMPSAGGHYSHASSGDQDRGCGSGVWNSQLGPSNPSFDGFDNEEDGCMSFNEQERIYNGNPIGVADAVSMALAFKKLTPSVNQQRRRIVPEERLCFGPRTIPIDGRVQKEPVIEVPEERLQIVDKPIIELKLSSCGRGTGDSGQCGSSFGVSHDEDDFAIAEALERERMEQEAESSAAGSCDTYITYDDLGYGPIAPSENQFINSPVATMPSRSPIVNVDDSACGPLGAPLPDYVPGNVIIQKHGDYGHVQQDVPYGDDALTGRINHYDVADSFEDDESSSESDSGYEYDGHSGSHSESSTSKSSGNLLTRFWKQASGRHDGCRSCFQ